MRTILLLSFFLINLFVNGTSGQDEKEDEDVDKIVGGGIVPNNRYYPYMVYFTRYDRRSNRHIFYCTGSLIAPQHVLTSASCFEGYASGVAFGPTLAAIAWLGTNVLGGPTAVSRYVIRVNKFPLYNPANFGNRDNIAVVKLQSEVLPTTATPGILALNSNPIMGVANELIAVGWGYSGSSYGFTSYLRHSWMNLISNSDCPKVFGNVDNANTICVAYDSVGACALDVGSPILSKDGKIIGVVGKDMRCGGGAPIVAVDIRAYYSQSVALIPFTKLDPHRIPSAALIFIGFDRKCSLIELNLNPLFSNYVLFPLDNI